MAQLFPRNFRIISCMNSRGGIGIKNKLPWRIPEELKHFNEMTKDNTVIMGMNTFQSIIDMNGRPLPNRLNMVVDKTIKGSIDNSSKNRSNIIKCRTLNDGLQYLYNMQCVDDLFVIGGGQIYEEAIKRHDCVGVINSVVKDKIMLDVSGSNTTKVCYDLQNVDCDTFFPVGELNNRFTTDIRDCLFRKDFRVEFYKQKDNYDEEQYLKLLKNVINRGSYKTNRTGVNTYSLTNQTLDFSLLNYKNESIVPLLTSRRIPYRLAFHELIWMLKGNTSIKYLTDNNVHIWDKNTSREFLDNHKGDLVNTYPENNLILGYPHLWRNYNYQTDQILYIQDLFKNEPDSRRIILNAWNPTFINEAVLPPCHILYQWIIDKNTDNKSFVDVSLTLRSSDLVLGLPFNIFNTTVLTHMLCKPHGYIPRKLTVHIGDAHIYENHVENTKNNNSSVLDLIKRPVHEFPRIQLDEYNKDIEEYKFENLKITGYVHNSPMKFDMVA